MKLTYDQSLDLLDALGLKYYSFHYEDGFKAYPYGNKTAKKFHYGSSGVFLKCGKINNLFVLDIDRPTSKIGKNLVKKAKKTKTFYEKTPHGFHFYFNLGNLRGIFSKTSHFHDLDFSIISNRGTVITAPTKGYMPMNTHQINDISEDLKVYILSLI